MLECGSGRLRTWKSLEPRPSDILIYFHGWFLNPIGIQDIAWLMRDLIPHQIMIVIGYPWIVNLGIPFGKAYRCGTWTTWTISWDDFPTIRASLFSIVFHIYVDLYLSLPAPNVGDISGGSIGDIRGYHQIISDIWDHMGLSENRHLTFRNGDRNREMESWYFMEI